MKKSLLGYTLLELLVVISLISILSSAVFFGITESSAQSRDVRRKADLRNVQIALELYKKDNGVYPQGCNSPGGWSGQTGSGTGYQCATGNEYIVGLAPKYITTLPTDPELNGTGSGYLYTTNTDGSVYKFMVRNTVESENVQIKHEFRSCDITVNNTGLCDLVYSASGYNTAAAACNSPQEPGVDGSGFSVDVTVDTVFDSSYAVWGGYAERSTISIANGNYAKFTERDTEAVVCQVP